jgi:hypothetical protein
VQVADEKPVDPGGLHLGGELAQARRPAGKVVRYPEPDSDVRPGRPLLGPFLRGDVRHSTPPYHDVLVLLFNCFKVLSPDPGERLMDDLLVRGGLVVDGTGAAARAADVRVRDGRVAEIGPGLRPDGERVLDASGAYVSPGFIDIHTHFDPTVFWDPMCDPMPQRGVTTVLVGNCSLSLAPVRPEHRESLQELLCYIEDLPADVLDVSIPWGWESYGEYLSATEKLGGFAVYMAGKPVTGL